MQLIIPFIELFGNMTFIKWLFTQTEVWNYAYVATTINMVTVDIGIQIKPLCSKSDNFFL